MITVVVTEEFEKRFTLLPNAIQNKAEKQRAIFCENPFHPSLHTEKLAPKKKEVWSFRIDRKYRIAFRFIDGETVLLLTAGPHDWIYKLNFR